MRRWRRRSSYDPPRPGTARRFLPPAARQSRFSSFGLRHQNLRRAAVLSILDGCDAPPRLQARFALGSSGSKTMSKWTGGNQFSLLENGEAFFPRVFECIAAAEREVILETFIWFDDEVGKQLQKALIAAGRRGVRVDVTIDDYGSPDLSAAFLSELAEAGVRVHVFDPGPRLWGWRTNVFRRMHRKIVVIDGARAFVGGINYSVDHLIRHGPEGKQDYAVEATGPIVQSIHAFTCKALEAGRRNARTTLWSRLSERFFRRAGSIARTLRPDNTPPADSGSGSPQKGGAAIFVIRDNRKHTDDIERHYRVGIRAARKRIIIANAYFFPGYRLLKELRKAARRGVDVRLILQGQPDMPIVKVAASMLYHHLIAAGVHVHEFIERPLHGKVAVFDDQLATVGSSNLDPLSLSLNLEANLVIKDAGFNQTLTERLQHLLDHGCKEIGPGDIQESGRWRIVRSFFVFHFLRLYPAWGGWLPAHAPQLQPAHHPVAPESEPAGNHARAAAEPVHRTSAG
jgi:cardiolipin synthase A/B